jgi:hypothetical protein
MNNDVKENKSYQDLEQGSSTIDLIVGEIIHLSWNQKTVEQDTKEIEEHCRQMHLCAKGSRQEKLSVFKNNQLVCLEHRHTDMKGSWRSMHCCIFKALGSCDIEFSSRCQATDWLIMIWKLSNAAYVEQAFFFFQKWQSDINWRISKTAVMTIICEILNTAF